MTPLKFGLTLPNRGVLFGVETMANLLDMGQEADESGLFRSLWVGDSILAKRRPESVSLLSALAARTKKVRLAVGCMASFPVRHPVLLAAQWATLDQIAGPGRALLAACIGGEGGGGDWQMENDAFGVPQGERIGRMVTDVVYQTLDGGMTEIRMSDQILDATVGQNGLAQAREFTNTHEPRYSANRSENTSTMAAEAERIWSISSKPRPLLTTSSAASSP